MEELNAITRKEKFLAKAAGQDVETPEPITREEMFLSKIKGGGVSSWNDLTDKPFGEELVESIEWDGSTDGRYTVEWEGMTVVHFTDTVISDPNELIGSRVLFFNGDGETIIDGVFDTTGDLGVAVISPKIIMAGAGIFLCVQEDNSSLVNADGTTLSFDKKGVYAVATMFEAFGATSAKIIFANPVSEIKTLDEKYLPDSVKNGGGLPVVVLTTPIERETETPLSEEEYAAFTVAATTGLPIVIKMTFGGMGMSFVCYCTDMGDAKVYIFETDMAKLQFTWTAESCVGGFEPKA